MKTAVLFVFMSAAFAGHYIVQAQTHFLKPSKTLFWQDYASLEHLDAKAHAKYNGLDPVPRLGPEVLKDYPATREALRLSYLSECTTVDSQLTVRFLLDNDGKVKSHSFPGMEYKEDLDHILGQLSFKRALIRGLSLVDITFRLTGS